MSFGRTHSIKHMLRKLLRDEGGQALPAVAGMLICLIGASAIAIDVGHLYVCSHELQNSTDAAALAGAQALPGTSAVTTATSYSSVSGAMNTYANLQSVAMVSGYPMVKCLTTLTNQGIACTAPENANAIVVAQQAVVPTFFAKVLGYPTVTINAMSTAAARGASATPYNVAIIVDTTGSMGSTDSDTSCNASRISCSLLGVRTLLSALAPCGSALPSCGTVTGGNVANPVDKVSLFTFPNVSSSANAANYYNCSGTVPTETPYTFPTAGASTYSPSADTYRVLDFNSDYRTSDTATSLVQSSNLVIAAGGNSSCPGMTAPGGISTYYAGVIYAAQAALTGASAAHAQNVMILLSDGDANEWSAQMPGASTTSGVYPSTVSQCQQAVTAAQAAAAAGTRVYSVAYGSGATGCASDTNGITPCDTMRQIASAPQYFFSDYNATGADSTCVSAAQPTTSLSQIFASIANDLTAARLIPNGTP